MYRPAQQDVRFQLTPRFVANQSSSSHCRSWFWRENHSRQVLDSIAQLPGCRRKCFMLFETIARGWENLVGRLGGPMSFRFLMQPAVAIFFAVRAGLKDARAKQPDVSGVCPLESEFVAGADAAVLEGRGDSLHRRGDLGRDLPSHRAFRNLRVGIADHGDRLGAGAVHDRARSCGARREMVWRRKPADRSLPNDKESQI